MKGISELTVTVTYTVQLSEIRVSDTVFEQLTNSSHFNMSDNEDTEAFDWLTSNIDENSAMELEYEIDNLEI